MKEPALNPNDIALLEQSLIKIPLDSLKKNLRTSQRNIERDLTQVSNGLENASNQSKEDAIKSVNSMILRVRGLKRKLSDLNEASVNTTRAATARVDHLQELYNLTAFSSPEYRNWARIRLLRQIIDHMLRQGQHQSAAQLAERTGVQDLVDVALFKECQCIEASLHNQSVKEALDWCRENQNALKKIKSTFEFELRYQEFIELVRARKPEEAIQHSRKHLVTWGATHMQLIKQAMVLLAFGPDTTCPPYKKLFEASRWDNLAIAFRYTLLQLHALPPCSMLSLTLHTGLAALKTPSCFAKTPLAHNIDCPTCSEFLGKLAQLPSVPWAHHVNSTLVCKITRKVIEGQDEGSEPMALPNGRVYSREALEALATARSDGKVECPRTGEVYRFTELLKVFIS